VYVAVGYWAGRFRELRDPQSALVPLAIGAGATAAAMVGYSLMQFLLGVDAPVSFLLAREILATVLLNGVIATPVYAGVRRVLLPALPRTRAGAGAGPTPPAACRRSRAHDRSRPCQRPSPADHAAARAARAILGGIAFVLFAIVFFRLWYLQVLSGDQYLQQARDNRVRELRVQAPRGRHPRSQRPHPRRESRRDGRPARSREPAGGRARRGRELGPAGDRALAPAEGQEGDLIAIRRCTRRRLRGSVARLTVDRRSRSVVVHVAATRPLTRDGDGRGIAMRSPFLPFGRRERAVTCWPQFAAASRSAAGRLSGSSWTTVAARFSTRMWSLRSRMAPRGGLHAQLAHAVVARLLQVLIRPTAPAGTTGGRRRWRRARRRSRPGWPRAARAAA